MEKSEPIITRCDQTSFAELVAFIAGINSNGADHIGYFDTAADDITRSLRELALPVDEGFRLAIDDGRIVGLLGVEADAGIGRAWIYGPLVQHSQWPSVADRLYAAVLPAIPPGIQHYQLFCDRRNQNCRAFAARHGFALINESVIMTLSRADLGQVPAAAASPIEAACFAQFRELHPRLMPNTYFTAQQILDRLGADSHLRIVAHGSELLGYIYYQAGPGVAEAYIDFVAVAETARGRGIGAQLVAAAVHHTFSWQNIDLIRLTVNASNSPALRLYERLGFRQERTMMGFESNSNNS